MRTLGRWMRGDILAALSLTYLFILLFVALLAPWIQRYSPVAQDFSHILAPISWRHWLGTDDLGRDIYSRIVNGTATSLYASSLVVAVAAILGIPAGVAAGYFGGRTDAIISRLTETLMSFPGVVLAVGVTGAVGVGVTPAMVATGIVFSPMLARLARAQTLVVRESTYVEAAISFGASSLHVIWRHVLPNAIQPVLVQLTIISALALLAEASLSFLGLGVQPPSPSWGAMLARAYTYMEVEPWQMFPPGLAILFTALALNFLGESARVRLDPSRRH